MHGWQWPLILGFLGVCGVLFLRIVWYEWYPKLKDMLDSVPVRMGFRVLTFIAGVYGHIQARLFLNTLTGVEPSNFSATLLTFTAVAVLTAWIMLIGMGAMLCLVGYAVKEVRSSRHPPQRTGPLGPWFREWLRGVRRDVTYLFGPFAIFAACGGLLIMLGEPPFNSMIRTAAKVILVTTEFSYDKTCAASSETRWVAPLKDRKEMKVSNVLIADVPTLSNIQFSIGHCE